MWNKGKRIENLEHEVQEVKHKIAFLEQVNSLFETNLRSMRGRMNQKVGKLDATEEESSSSSDIDEIAKAFGGSVPVELVEKYKNR
jgi:predicted nuclease with TOPRIM domain